jgi:hypothetical protein
VLGMVTIGRTDQQPKSESGFLLQKPKVPLGKVKKGPGDQDPSLCPEPERMMLPTIQLPGTGGF